MATAKSGGFLRYFKLECSLPPMSTTSSQPCSCVCSAILVALVSVIILGWDPLLVMEV